MATAADFTFSAYNFATQQAVNAYGPLLSPVHIRDRSGSIVIGKVGDYVLKDEDGGLHVMKGSLFTAEYAAAVAPTAPSVLAASGPTVSAIDLSWTIGSATSLPHIEQDTVEIAINAANDNTYTATGLTANTGYSFRVRNSLNEAYSAYLAPLTAYTLPVPIVAAPTSSAHTTTTITISWVNADATAQTEITHDDGLGGAFAVSSTEAAGVTTKVITGLTTGRTYLIKLKHKGVLSTLVSATFSPTLSQVTA